MSRQQNFAKKQFFQKSMARAQAMQKRKKDILALKSGEVVPDPKEVVDGNNVEVVGEEIVPDPEEVIE